MITLQIWWSRSRIIVALRIRGVGCQSTDRSRGVVIEFNCLSEWLPIRILRRRQYHAAHLLRIVLQFQRINIRMLFVDVVGWGGVRDRWLLVTQHSFEIVLIIDLILYVLQLLRCLDVISARNLRWNYNIAAADQLFLKIGLCLIAVMLWAFYLKLGALDREEVLQVVRWAAQINLQVIRRLR